MRSVGNANSCLNFTNFPQMATGSQSTVSHPDQMADRYKLTVRQNRLKRLLRACRALSIRFPLNWPWPKLPTSRPGAHPGFHNRPTICSANGPLSGDRHCPEDRPEGETYEVRRFDSVYESIRSYLRNLNTHFAYRELRQVRAEARAENKPIEGFKLAEGLFRYSVRGEEYVRDLQSLILTNRLDRFADVSLRTKG